MKVYTLPDGSKVSAFDQFQIGDQKYPPGWLLTMSDVMATSLGITVAVVADPIPPVATTVPTNVMLGRLTPAEKIAIYKAAASQMVSAGNAGYMMWLTATNAAGFINLLDQTTLDVKAAIVAAGLLTQARADVVFAP